MQLFYSKDITPNGFCTLDAEESRHIVRVLRRHEGDSVDVTDGHGNLYQCKIIDANDRACVVECVGQSDNQAFKQPNIHLAVAPTKNPARMEWLVEKAVEIGVGEITLLQCDHSERSFLKTDRLEKLAVSAMKQSLHLTLPKINPAIKLSDWLTQTTEQSNNQAIKLIAHCEADKPRVPIATALAPRQDTIVLIGPEGDFSSEEIDLALQCGFHPVSLGPSRLRTETAALYAVAAFNLINDHAL